MCLHFLCESVQKGSLRFDKLLIIAIMKMSFLRGGAAKGLAVPPHFCKNSNFSVGQFSSKNPSFLISKKTYKLSHRKAVVALRKIVMFHTVFSNETGPTTSWWSVLRFYTFRFRAFS